MAVRRPPALHDGLRAALLADLRERKMLKLIRRPGEKYGRAERHPDPRVEELERGEAVEVVGFEVRKWVPTVDRCANYILAADGTLTLDP